MNDTLQNFSFTLSKKKNFCFCNQKSSLTNYIARELNSDKSKHEKAEKIFKLILQELNKETPRESLKARANRALMLSLLSKAEIDLLEQETRTPTKSWN